MNNGIISPAAQVIIALIPIVGIVIGGIVVFFYLLWRHKQVSLLIKSNSYQSSQFNLRLFSLLVGLLLTGIGVVLTTLFILVEQISYTLLGGLIPLALGVGMLVFFNLHKH